MSNDPSHVVLFPEGWDRVAKIAAASGAAVGISQDGEIITVNTGLQRIPIDAFGRDISQPSSQEKLC